MSEAEALSPPSEESAKGLDAIIGSALDEANYGGEAPVEEKTAEPELKVDADGRIRTPDGKFAPKVSTEAKPSDPEPAAAEVTTAAPVTAEPPKVEPIQPHPRWDDALKAQFAAWPPEAQKAFLDRHNAIEGDYTRKTQELAETRKAVEPLVQEVTKWSPYLQQLGVSPDKAFTQMLQTEYTLRTGTPEQRSQALAYLANLYAVPLPNSQTGEVEPTNPVISQLHQTVTGLQQQLRQISEQRTNEERQRAQAEFDALGKATDQNGSLKYPHFSQVNNAMIQLVASGQADTWDAAYAKAVRLDDGLYQQTVEAERQRVLQEQEKQRLEAVEKAKKAKPVNSSDGAPKGGAKLTGIDAHLSAAMERFGT